MRVMIVVTHLLGTGHLARALTLARAFLEKDHEVLVVSGGMPAPLLDRGDVALLQLPPLKSDGTNFTALLQADGRSATSITFDQRRQMLAQSLDDFSPHALITELYPFGRRTLSNEFTGLLEAARAMARPPITLASIRDILAPPSKPEKARLTDAVVSRYYDAVLVHSDPELVPLSRSWPVSETLEPYLRYTGFVAPPVAARHPEGLGEGEIIVSAGGGSVGGHIFEAAEGAARLDPSLRWRVLVGGADAAGRIAQINANAPANLKAEGTRPDFRQMLHHTVASVSMCGYNTALDILQTGAPALFIPFDAGSEVEQGLRAAALARQDGLQVLESAALTPHSLLRSLKDLMQSPRRPIRTEGLDGAQETVRVVMDMVGEAE